MIRRLLCRLGLHAWLFAYAARRDGKGYGPEVCCLRCLARPTARHVALWRVLCAAGVHRVQALTAPPSWRPGDGWARGEYCIFCTALVRVHRREAWRSFVVEWEEQPGRPVDVVRLLEER